ncbi:MAG TPA: hypothetical protein DDY13_07650 [Cytophagales bacterium]|jgi:ketosteroid isomerase-like protein|nr:hypothetical protein [Cytophagales bacterium]
MKDITYFFRFPLTAFFSLFFLIGQAQDNDHELDRPYEKMTEAYEKLEARLLHEVYFESALYMSPDGNQKIQKGIDSFIDGFEGMFRNAAENGDQLRISFKIEKRMQGEKMVVDAGYYKLLVVTKERDERESYGKFVTVLKKDPADGKWKFALDGYNASPPVVME